jgi:hypothetical protein
MVLSVLRFAEYGPHPTRDRSPWACSMTTSFEAWRHLQRVGAALAAGLPLAEIDAEWLIHGIATYENEASRGRRLDDCLGLSPLPYTTAWWEVVHESKRNELLARLWHQMDGAPRPKAEKIERLAARYAPKYRQMDRMLKIPPSEYVGKPEAIFFELHRLDVRWPLKWRRIMDICVQQQAIEIAQNMEASSA